MVGVDDDRAGDDNLDKDRWLRVTPTCRIGRDELRWKATRSGGPGGQHANTSDTRSQARNRDVATERLRERLAAALRVDPPRRPTRATRGSQRRRVEQKRRRGETKRKRGRPDTDD